MYNQLLKTESNFKNRIKNNTKKQQRISEYLRHTGNMIEMRMEFYVYFKKTNFQSLVHSLYCGYVIVRLEWFRATRVFIRMIWTLVYFGLLVCVGVQQRLNVMGAITTKHANLLYLYIQTSVLYLEIATNSWPPKCRLHLLYWPFVDISSIPSGNPRLFIHDQQSLQIFLYSR